MTIRFTEKHENLLKNQYMCGNGGAYLFFCKISIIKTFAIPNLIVRASLIPIPNDREKEVNTYFFTILFRMVKMIKSSALRSSQILIKVD